MVASSLAHFAAVRLRAYARLLYRFEEVFAQLVGAFAWLLSLGFSAIYSPLRTRGRTA